MRIEQLKIEILNKNNWNPNEMQSDIFHSLVASIQKHGVLQPIVVREDFTIIKGEKRWLAAKEAGLDEIYCVIVETSQEEAKLLTVGLSHLRGTTNEEMLSALLSELTEHFSLEEISLETGFLKDELTSLFDDLAIDIDVEAVKEDDFNVQQALDEIKESD